jgi:hypothetical protein
MSQQLPGPDDCPGRGDHSAYSYLSPFPGEIAGVSELVCGECQQPRPGTASYSVLHIIFLLVVVVWRVDPVFKCPSCMRWYLLQRLPLSLLMATLFAPVILIWWCVLFLRTLGR